MKVLSKPCGLAIILCDDIIEDKHSGKKSLIGIFNEIYSFHFPAKRQKIAIFVSLMGGNGEYEAVLKMRDPENKVIFSGGGKISITHPFQVADMLFTVYNMAFMKTGRHVIEFYCNEELVFERHFMLHQLKGEIQ